MAANAHLSSFIIKLLCTVSILQPLWHYRGWFQKCEQQDDMSMWIYAFATSKCIQGVHTTLALHIRAQVNTGMPIHTQLFEQTCTYHAYMHPCMHRGMLASGKYKHWGNRRTRTQTHINTNENAHGQLSAYAAARTWCIEECTWVQINTFTFDFFLLAIYRPRRVKGNQWPNIFTSEKVDPLCF